MTRRSWILVSRPISGSVILSARYSWVESPERFFRGKTAMDLIAEWATGFAVRPRDHTAATIREARTTTPPITVHLEAERCPDSIDGTAALSSTPTGATGISACEFDAPFLQTTGAAKRYPFPTTVSTNRGFSGSSLSTWRILRTAVLML